MQIPAISTEWEMKQAVKASKAQKLRAQFPHLVPANSGGSSYVIAAKNMRIELKRAFSGVKFSVRSRSFSMGDAIDVRWTDGPTSKQVNAIIHKYSGGSFNGMDDSYTYESTAWTDAFGDSKYVHAQREFSDSFVGSVIETLSKKYTTLDGYPAPTVEEYRMGKIWNNPWENELNRTLSGTSA